MQKKVNKSIVISVETGALDDNQNITFYDNGEAFMNKQLALVQRHYAKKNKLSRSCHSSC